ncbi:MAG: hypothetical protein KC620_20780, partial [Myxococcales bacterium]|nr:hypothetical protein [Myxococcales bacterium]
EVIALLEHRLADDPGVAYRLGLALEAGRGDRGGAREIWHAAAVEPGPDRVAALAGLRRAAWRDEATEDYLDAIEGLAALADAELRAALFTHLGDVLSMRADEPEAARRRYGDAIEAALVAAEEAPLALPAAVEERLRLLAAENAWGAIESELRRLLDHGLPAHDEATVAARLAELCETRLDRPDEALNLYQRVLRLDPDDRVAHRAVQRMLAARADWPELVTTLEAERDRAEPSRRLAVLGRLAAVHEACGEPDLVEACWREALDLDPSWLPALRGLGRLLYQHGRWRELAELVRHELRTLPADDVRRIGLLGRLAELYEFRLDLLDEAIECFEAIRSARPEAPDALAGLERLYAATEQWSALADVLNGRADAADEPEDRAAILLRLADVRLDHLDDVEGALDACEEALALAPGLLPITWTLERLALERDESERLTALYRTAGPHLRSPNQQAVTAHKLANVAPPDLALATLEERAGPGFDDAEAAWALVRDAAKHGDLASLPGRLARVAQLVDAREDALALFTEAAERAEAAELPSAEIIAVWQQVRALAPEADRPWEATLRQLRLARATGERSETLLQWARITDDVRARSAALWLAGLIEEARGFDPVAQDAWREAEEACDRDPVPAWLLLDRARHDELVPLDDGEHARLLEALADRRDHRAAAAAHLTQAGALRADRPGEGEQALADFIEAVQRDPTHEEAAQRAADMLAARHAYGDLATLLTHRIERLPDPAARLPLLRRLAAVQLDELGAREAGEAALAAIVALDPDDLDTRVRLGDLRFASEAFAEAAEHYKHATTLARDDRLLARLYTRSGRIKAHHLSDIPGAIDDLRRAVGLGPDVQALGELAQVYLLAEQPDLARTAFERLEKLAENEVQRAEARAGQVHALVRLGRRPEALEKLTAFREADPVNPLLARLARDLGVETSAPSIVRERV